MNALDSAQALHRLQWRTLQTADLDTMYALHLRSIAGMALATVKPETREFLHSLLEGRGQVIGAWQGRALVAYGVLQHDLLAYDDPRALLGLGADARVGKLAGAAVEPAWRGLGLQRILIDQRMACAADATLFATAAPGNPASWRSLLACGLQVRAVQYLYGGHARYLLARVPGEAWTPGQRQELPAGAIDQQAALLAQGWRGVSPGVAPQSLCLAAAAEEGRRHG